MCRNQQLKNTVRQRSCIFCNSLPTADPTLVHSQPLSKYRDLPCIRRIHARIRRTQTFQLTNCLFLTCEFSCAGCTPRSARMICFQFDPKPSASLNNVKWCKCYQSRNFTIIKNLRKKFSQAAWTLVSPREGTAREKDSSVSHRKLSSP